MKKKKITFSEPNCRFGCPHFKSVGSVLNETCYCMKKGKSGPKRLFAVPAEMPTFMQVYHGNMCNWAQQQPAVAHVLAQTEQGNLASERVLQKCGFRKCAAGPVVWWILSW